MDHRLAIRRKPNFRDEEQALLATLRNLDGVTDLAAVQIVHLYDMFHAEQSDIAALETVVRDERVDDLLSENWLAELSAGKSAAAAADEPAAAPARVTTLAVQPLPGQYDQRADAAEQALRLLRPTTKARVYSAQCYVFTPALSDSALTAIRSYLINPVEAGEKDLTAPLAEPDMGQVEPLLEYPDFLERDAAGLAALVAERGMAMSVADLACIQDYFRAEKRLPTEVELAVLDTYWSDHCRHTTFNTGLTDITNHSQLFKGEIDQALQQWQALRAANGRADQAPTLMDLGTIVGKDLRRRGILTDQEVSEEINACSVHVPVELPDAGAARAAGTSASTGDDAAKASEPWLLMFKNETHNHPTEIEPFGGAATCLGGAIRDPLSGRSWVYQALRLSGAGDINTPRAATLPGKLPQADISARATAGYSSYGNQIGLATTAVHEFVHPGYVAKRMELGAVVAAAPEANVRRLTPQPGDVIILVGGRTGRDGIGGATGSSKAHTEQSLTTAGAEVQKGNPVNERKIQRLFRQPKVAQMIVRCNDFGAGGVAVAVGELAPSLDIHLERVPLKYAGLNAKEIAISESQERMAVCVHAADAPAFAQAAAGENLEATVLAEVTDTGRLRMYMRDTLVLDLARSFIDTNGAPRSQAVEIRDPEPPTAAERSGLAASTGSPSTILAALARPNAGSQEGMVEQFDSTVGRSTVLMPFGGQLQKTKETASIQTLPMAGGTNTASVMTFGYSPALADRSPYLMGAYSVVEALSRLTAAGADPAKAWLTVQEYFQRPDQDPKVWGDVLQALLGLLEAQEAFAVAAIGGKDSMSGTFEEDGQLIHVPPTVVTFAVGAMDARQAVSATLPYRQLDLYYLPHTPLTSGRPNYAQLRRNFAAFNELAQAGGIVAASPVLAGGLGVTLTNMCLGNEVGFFASSTSAHAYLTPGQEATQLANTPLGGIVFAVDPLVNVTPLFTVGGALGANAADASDASRAAEAAKPQVIYLGATTDKNHTLDFGFERFTVAEALQVLEAGYAHVFPINRSDPEALPAFATALPDSSAAPVPTPLAPETAAAPAPHVLLPVFPGTNSEYDMAEAFRAAGATTEFLVIRNLTPEMLEADTQAFIAKVADARTSIVAFSGGFTLGDEPDGSAKFMAAFLRAPAVAAALKEFISPARDGLMLGICNGFQALVKSGFLPYGDPDKLTATSPTLTYNRQLRHVSRIATTRLATTPTASPWLSGFAASSYYKVPVSHGEGRFVVSDEEAQQLFAAGQVAFQYVDHAGAPTMAAPENPNGSSYAIEGLISPDGRVLGKMGHPERFRAGLMRNIPDIAVQDIFANAVNYCRAHSAA